MAQHNPSSSQTERTIKKQRSEDRTTDELRVDASGNTAATRHYFSSYEDVPLMKKKKRKVADRTESRVTLWNPSEKRKLSGNAAPFESNVLSYLLRHPVWEVYTNQDVIADPSKSKKKTRTLVELPDAPLHGHTNSPQLKQPAVYSVGELANVGTYSTGFIGNPIFGGTPLDSNAQMINNFALSAMLSQAMHNAGSNNHMMAKEMLPRHDPLVQAAGMGHCIDANDLMASLMSKDAEINALRDKLNGLLSLMSKDAEINALRDKLNKLNSLMSKDAEVNALRDKLERAGERSQTLQDAIAVEDVSGRPQNQTNADIPESEHCLNQPSESRSQDTATGLEEEACEKNVQEPIN